MPPFSEGDTSTKERVNLNPSLHHLGCIWTCLTSKAELFSWNDFFLDKVLSKVWQEQIVWETTPSIHTPNLNFGSSTFIYVLFDSTSKLFSTYFHCLNKAKTTGLEKESPYIVQSSPCLIDMTKLELQYQHYWVRIP